MTESPRNPGGAIASQSGGPMARAAAQPVLFGSLNRASLARCRPGEGARAFSVRVHGNHSIAAVSSAVPPFAAWNDLSFRFDADAYDESLTFATGGDADIHLVWLDTVRVGLSATALAEWLGARLAALRGRTDAPIVALAWPLSAAQRSIVERLELPDVHLADLDALARGMAERWTDSRTEALAGTRLSNHACMSIARELACCWLPAALLPPVKCIAVDLDGTLYEGTLGEDGVAGLRLDEGHAALQRSLARLRGEGMLLALVSRNEAEDARSLFAARRDFPLDWSDFSAVEVSWDEKSEALKRVAQRLRIDASAIVLVDDNPGELARVAARLPVTTVHARPDARETEAALLHVAGVFRWRQSSADRLRAGDLRAAALRPAWDAAGGPDADYLRELGVALTFHVGAHVARMAELVRKTNQWNLSLRRTGEAQIARRLAEHPRNAITISLEDRLSDSGVIAAVVGHVEGGTLHVLEAVVSCRALGRGVEDALIIGALQLMAEGRAVRRVRFCVGHGPRNLPARDWLARYAAQPVGESIDTLDMSSACIDARPGVDHVLVRVEEAHEPVPCPQAT